MSASPEVKSQVLTHIREREFRCAALGLLVAAEERSKLQEDPDATDRMAELAIELHRLSADFSGLDSASSNELKSAEIQLQNLDASFLDARKWFADLFGEINKVTIHPPGSFFSGDSDEARLQRILNNYDAEYIFANLVREIEMHCQFAIGLSLKWSFANGLCRIQQGKLHAYAKARIELLEGYEEKISGLKRILTEAAPLLTKIGEVKVRAATASESISRIEDEVNRIFPDIL